MDRHSLLLAEYAEAGQVSRAHEQNVRNSLNAYLVIAAAVITVCFTGAITNAGRAVLCFFAFVTGVFILNTVFRHRAYYSSYIGRAKAIEKELGISLYLQAREDIKSSRTFSNKLAIAAVFVLLVAAFGVAAFILAFQV